MNYSVISMLPSYENIRLQTSTIITETGWQVPNWKCFAKQTLLSNIYQNKCFMLYFEPIFFSEMILIP